MDTSTLSMPLFSAKSGIFERAQSQCKRLKLLELDEWTIKLGRLFHTSIHRSVQPTRGCVTGSGNQIRASINAMAANKPFGTQLSPSKAREKGAEHCYGINYTIDRRSGSTPTGAPVSSGQAPYVWRNV